MIYYVGNKKKNTVKEVKMYTFLVCAYKSQDFAQNLKKIARLHERGTVTFRNSAYRPYEVGPGLLELGQEIPQNKTVGRLQCWKVYCTKQTAVLLSTLQGTALHCSVQTAVL